MADRETDAPRPGEVWEGIPDRRRKTQRRRVAVEHGHPTMRYGVSWRWEDSEKAIWSSLANWCRWARKQVGQVTTAAPAAEGMNHE